MDKTGTKTKMGGDEGEASLYSMIKSTGDNFSSDHASKES